MKTHTQETRKLITAAELAGEAGLARSTIYRLAAQGALPAVRVGRSLRFDSALVARLLRRAGER